MAETPHAARPLLVIDDIGTGPPVLLLHGGGGPVTVAPIAEHLAKTHRVMTPTLPGWNGAPRPETLATIGDYAQTFLEHLATEDLNDVVAIGSSLGGWIAAEMAARDRTRVLAGVVLIDAAGITVDGEPITDFFSLTPREVFEHSFHDPDRFFVDPTTLPPERAEIQNANMQTMALVARDMNNPGLRAQLTEVTVPALAIWGDSDRIFTPGYGRAYADSFANGQFALVIDAGHLPQIEQPAATLALIDAFLGRVDGDAASRAETTI
jgi:pimeloyl-ACP methyl ester carboxylesterase